VRLPRRGLVFEALQAALEVENTASLSRGRDVREAGDYSRLELQAAWRVENANGFDRYAVQRAAIAAYAQRVTAGGGALPRVAVRPALAEATSRLEESQLLAGINETFLMHGTRPETVLPIARGGLNERFSCGHFGSGSYLAEVSDKINQYVVKESKAPQGAVEELHGRLYADGAERAGGAEASVYYGFVCRAVLGHFVRTRDGHKALDGGEDGKGGFPIFARGAARRELAAIPAENGGGGGELFHSLLVEVGGKVKRHREFVFFHSDRVYPEYLLAFTRAAV